MDAIRDGWCMESLGHEARELANSMSWMGRSSMKRMLKTINQDFEL